MVELGKNGGDTNSQVPNLLLSASKRYREQDLYSIFQQGWQCQSHQSGAKEVLLVQQARSPVVRLPIQSRGHNDAKQSHSGIENK